ncbi:hypothetical protein ABL78_8441 [Leptomonas seymouri]|uniref:Uncharacterized protein n=1 Tax=Leptomonas seymouri TaxID=5684 RepID=A0A0N0P253_LEPSE|nr:hypothetical protein ABL78_8441 [Leptomonas seymouri]|eukprot:KPI82549.1 hypothetical protein ABL78_8441 [Leptomonas seymouri]
MKKRGVSVVKARTSKEQQIATHTRTYICSQGEGAVAHCTVAQCGALSVSLITPRISLSPFYSLRKRGCDGGGWSHSEMYAPSAPMGTAPRPDTLLCRRGAGHSL